MDRYDWMLRRGGGRPHGPPPRNPPGPRGMPPGQWGSPEGGYGYRDRGVYGEAYPGPAPGFPGMRGRGGHTLGGGNRGGRERVPGEFGDAPYGSYGYGGMRGGFGGQGGGGSRGYGGQSGGGGFRGGYGQGYGGGGPSQGRGYDRGWGGEGGFAREPFMPEEAYRRHPEYNQPPGAGRGYEFDWEDDEDMDDGQVLRAVRERMNQDVWLDPDQINVEVEDGVVTLTGEVDDFLEARYAWDDAWESPGVRGVINNLTVRTDEPHAASETHGDVVPQSSGARTVLEGDAGGGTGGYAQRTE